MPIDQATLDVFQRWINAKRPGGMPACPICSGKSWGIDAIVAPPIYDGGTVQLGGPAHPMLQVVCAKCAYVMQFAAVPIGLVK